MFSKKYFVGLVLVVAFCLMGAECQGPVDATGEIIKFGDMVDPLVRTLTPVFPWLEGATMLGLALRAWHNKKTATNVIKATTEATKQGKLDFTELGTKILLSRVMGSAGKKLVDQAQGKRRSFPI